MTFTMPVHVSLHKNLIPDPSLISTLWFPVTNISIPSIFDFFPFYGVEGESLLKMCHRNEENLICKCIEGFKAKGLFFSRKHTQFSFHLFTCHQD